MEYGYHVYNLFKEYFLSEPIVYNRKNINGNLVKTLRFHSISHKAFDFLVELFLDINRKKHISKNLIKDHW